MKRILTIIPAHNEAATVADVVREVRSLYPVDVLVVDDCSSDATAIKARQAGANVMTLPIQLGAWGATQTGMRYARQRGYLGALTMDADGQHHPSSLEPLLLAILHDETDVAIGSCVGRATRLRRMAWSFFRRLGSLELDDLTSGLRAYSSSAIDTLIGREATLLDYQDVGVLVLLRRHKQRVSEIPVSMSQRCNGKSRIFCSWSRVANYMFQTTILCTAKLGSYPKKHGSKTQG